MIEQKEKDEIAEPGDKTGANIAPQRKPVRAGIAERQAPLETIV